MENASKMFYGCRCRDTRFVCPSSHPDWKRASCIPDARSVCPYIFIGKANLKKKAIPYIVANRYFLKNGVETLPPQKITNQKDFDSYFGTAAVMGENGNPTDINFSTQYVSSLTRPETDIETRLVPKSLETNQKGEIVLCYQEIQGQKRTYTTKPLLLIIVDKKYDGNVVLSKVE